MSTPTLHTGFNKLILIDPIRKGIVNSAIQYSIYIPSIETTGKNAKQVSINQYIVNTLNQNGWF